jgi:hypothetical protein
LVFGWQGGEIATPFRHLAIPFDLLSALADKVDSVRDVVTVNDNGSSLLKTASRLLGFRETNVHLTLEERTMRRDGMEVIVYGSPKYFFTKKDGARIPLDRLSFGQKRLFGFCYYLALSSVVVADELANGLHHSMIQDCLCALGDRQAFLATQNPLLLDHLGFESSEEVRSMFVLCRSSADSGHERWMWTRMSEGDAGEFFGDYKVGIQHTNDILRTRDLW